MCTDVRRIYGKETVKDDCDESNTHKTMSFNDTMVLMKCVEDDYCETVERMVISWPSLGFSASVEEIDVHTIPGGSSRDARVRVDLEEGPQLEAKEGYWLGLGGSQEYSELVEAPRLAAFWRDALGFHSPEAFLCDVLLPFLCDGAALKDSLLFYLWRILSVPPLRWSQATHPDFPKAFQKRILVLLWLRPKLPVDVIGIIAAHMLGSA